MMEVLYLDAVFSLLPLVQFLFDKHEQGIGFDLKKGVPQHAVA
jgi:hypothetical protein